jgi:CRISPR/Cas system-associated endonuclease Cas1
MARHYYLTRAGRLKRRDNTLAFEPIEVKTLDEHAKENPALAEEAENALPPIDLSESLLNLADGDGLGDLSFNQPEERFAVKEDETESEKPVRVGSERRTIPVEDVDALWVFGEIDINSKALVFLSQNKIPVHFFNYYGFYAGTFYPREYLQAGFVLNPAGQALLERTPARSNRQTIYRRRSAQHNAQSALLRLARRKRSEADRNLAVGDFPPRAGGAHRRADGT